MVKLNDFSFMNLHTAPNDFQVMINKFKYFIKTLLSEVQPKRTRCKRARGQETISKCFTASDEAFALIVLSRCDMNIPLFVCQMQKQMTQFVMTLW